MSGDCELMHSQLRDVEQLKEKSASEVRALVELEALRKRQETRKH